MKFRELAIGQWFDFVSGDIASDSFYERCQKTSARKYRWRNNFELPLFTKTEWLESEVGSIDCEVYNEGKQIAPGVVCKCGNGFCPMHGH